MGDKVRCRVDESTGRFDLAHGRNVILPPSASAVTLAGGARFETGPESFRERRAVAGGFEVVHEFPAADFSLIQHFDTSGLDEGVVLRLTVRAGKTQLTVDRLHPVAFDTRRTTPSAFEPGRGLWMWRFGTVSPGDPVLFIPLDSPDIPRTHDRDRWLIEGADRIAFTSETLAVFRSGSTGRTCLLGFVTLAEQACGFTVSRTREHFDAIRLELRCDLEGMVLAPGAEIRSETLLILAEDDAWSAVEHYNSRLVESHKPRFADGPLVGWSDWQYYRRGSTEADVLENLEVLAREKYPIEYVLVDDGFQRNMSDWLVPNERFPHGIQWLAERIREKGFKPGIWIAPLTAHESSALVREHPDWLLRDAAGQILSRDTHMGKVHTIDYTAPGAIEWLRTLVRTLVNDFGYRWIKLDGPIRRYYDAGVFRTPMTSVQHIRLALEVIRREAGDAIVEGEGYYGPSIGLVDTQRVTQDIQQDWPRLKHTAQVNLLSTFMHRKLWINNPDAFILRDTPTPAMTVDGVPEYVMNREEVQTEVTALALTGGVVMLTDRMKDLKPERKALVDCFIPVYEEPARPVDLFNGKVCPEVFRQRVFAEGESWEVVAVFNWEDEPRAMEAPIGREERVAFEFWTQKYLGVVRGVLAFDSVPAHGVRLVALRPVLDRPFVMGTSLHVTQGGVELRKQNWDPRAGLLTFTLRSWMKRDASVHVRLPGGSWVADVRCTSRLNSYAQHGSEHLAIAFAAGGEVGFEVLIAPSSVSS